MGQPGPSPKDIFAKQLSPCQCMQPLIRTTCILQAPQRGAVHWRDNLPTSHYHRWLLAAISPECCLSICTQGSQQEMRNELCPAGHPSHVLQSSALGAVWRMCLAPPEAPPTWLGN